MRVENAKKLAEAVRSVLADVESGKLALGNGSLFDREGQPCCFMGHALARAGYKRRTILDGAYAASETFLGAANYRNCAVEIGRTVRANDFARPELPAAAQHLAEVLEVLS